MKNTDNKYFQSILWFPTIELKGKTKNVFLQIKGYVLLQSLSVSSNSTRSQLMKAFLLETPSGSLKVMCFSKAEAATSICWTYVEKYRVYQQQT